MHAPAKGAEREIYFALCKAIDTPVSLANWLLYKYGEHEQLVRKAIDPRRYDSAHRFSGDYLVTKFLSKNKGLETGIDLKAAALAAFDRAETICAEANRRIVGGSSFDGILMRAAGIMQTILGSLDECKARLGLSTWGPGGTLEIPRRSARVDKKISKLPITVSFSALPYLRRVLENDPHWLAALLPGYEFGSRVSLLPCCFTISDSNRHSMVSKDAKTHRNICVEARGNAYLQRSVGLYLKQRLKSAGIDLSDQGVNQRLAKQALPRHLATLDLSMASDTVSREIVYALLPLDWALLLDALRARTTIMSDGSIRRLEKFSSMGNGYTFELETLIFYSLMKALGSRVAVAYGDDIIVEQSLYHKAVELLQFCGFVINEDKSFASGLFFESCGKHYFNKVDVTPVYQKNTLRGLDSVEYDAELIRMHNRLFRWGLRDVGGWDSRLDPAISACRRLAKGKLKESFIIAGENTVDNSGLLAFSDENVCFYEWELLSVTPNGARNGRATISNWVHLRELQELGSDLSFGYDEDEPTEAPSNALITSELALATSKYEWRRRCGSVNSIHINFGRIALR